MIDQMKVLRICSIIVSAAMALYAVIYALSGRWLLVALLLAMGVLLLLPCRLLARPETIRGLSSFMVAWIDIVIFVTQIFSQELAPGTALYACSIALSALFLSRPLVRLCCISSMVLFSAECVILSVQLGQPVEAPLVLGECLAAILVAYILLDQCVKNCSFYLTEAHTQKDASARLLSELDEKQKQNQQVLDRQQQLLAQIDQVSAQVSQEAESLPASLKTWPPAPPARPLPLPTYPPQWRKSISRSPTRPVRCRRSAARRRPCVGTPATATPRFRPCSPPSLTSNPAYTPLNPPSTSFSPWRSRPTSWP